MQNKENLSRTQRGRFFFMRLKLCYQRRYAPQLEYEVPYPENRLYE